MILGDGTEVRMGNTYGQGEVGDKRGSKEMDRCPLTIAFPLQVIILYPNLYCLFSLAYYRITYPLPCSHIPSHRIRLTHCLNPSL
jgi:hypothetical protein